jgi:hypothetical protein
MFFLCLVLDNCNSPEEPEKPKSKYRYNVEVIYSDVAEAESDFPLYLYYTLSEDWGAVSWGFIEMTKIGQKKARCYLPKVLTDDYQAWKHEVSVIDPNKQPWCKRGENIDVQGAYDQEISTSTYCSVLLFKMSKVS